MRGDDDLPRQTCHPVLGQDGYRWPFERIARGTCDDEHVTDEFGMPLPFQSERTQFGGEVQAALGRWLDSAATAQVGYRDPTGFALRRVATNARYDSREGAISGSGGLACTSSPGD
jgi:hypothetical protein